MAVAGHPGRQKQHIRSIRKHFFSGAVDPNRSMQAQLSRHNVLLAGSLGSPWNIPFAVNLALSAAVMEEPTLLVMPSPLVPAAARLLGAAPAQLGCDFKGGAAAIACEPYAGLTLAPPSLLSLLSRRREMRWLFELLPAAGRRGTWLYLQETPAEGAFVDPRGDARDALFLLGLDHLPEPCRQARGVWGSLPRRMLLNYARPSSSALLAGSRATRQRYQGYLEALRQLGRSAGTGPGEGGERP